MKPFPRPTRLSLAALAGALAVLPGCKVAGPDFKAPEVVSPAAFRTGDTAESAVAAPAQWWTLYGDPQLNALEEAALAGNFQIASALARLDEVRARLGLAKSDTALTLNASGTAKLAGESAVRTLPVPGQNIKYRESGDTYRLSLDASYEIDFWGRVRRSLESAKAQLESSRADVDTARLSLAAEVAQVYFSLQALDAERGIVERNLKLRRDQLALSESRFKAGLATDLDAERARLEVALLEQDRIELLRRREQNVDALRVLTGDPSRAIEVRASAFDEALPAVPAGLPSSLLKRRPDLLAAENTLAARSAEIGVADAAFFPSVRLTGSAGLESADLSRLLSRPSEFWQFGPSISVPLLNGRRNQSNLEAAQARFAASRADYQQKALVAFREVDDALVDLQRYREEAEALARAGDSARSVLDLSERRYRAGLVSYFEVIEAQRAVVANDRASLQTASARRLATLRLIKSLGGSW